MFSNTYQRFYHLTGLFPSRSSSESFTLNSTHTLRTFAQSLIGIFIPLYIFTLENKPRIYNVEPLDSIMWVLFFYLLRSIVIVLLMTTLTNLIFGKLNFKKSIFLSNVFLSISLLCISLSNKSFILLGIASITISLDVILYWIPYHLFFIRKSNTENGRFGKISGIRLLLERLASALGPITGGYIISLFGFNLLFSIGIILIIVSAIPVLTSIHEHKHGKHNATEIFRTHIKKKELFGTSIAFATIGLEDVVYAIFWPILLLFITRSFTNIGTLTSISVAISAIFAIYIGKAIDKNGPKLIHKIGIILNSVLHISRIFTNSIAGIYAIDISDKLNGTLYTVPFTAVTYEKANENHHESDFIIYRTMIIHIGVICGLTIILTTLPIIENWRLIFLILAILSPLTYLINQLPQAHARGVFARRSSIGA